MATNVILAIKFSHFCTDYRVSLTLINVNRNRPFRAEVWKLPSFLANSRGEMLLKTVGHLLGTAKRVQEGRWEMPKASGQFLKQAKVRLKQLWLEKAV